MRHLSLIAAVILLVTFAACARAYGADKAKPVVCLDYRVVDASLAVCSDSKKPFIMRNFDEMHSVRPDGTKVAVLVGWR